MPMKPSDVNGREEYRRKVDERMREKGDRLFRDGVEALKAFRDLFESDEDMDEFMAGIRRDREFERAKYGR
jgi:hypothetical protein